MSCAESLETTSIASRLAGLESRVGTLSRGEVRRDIALLIADFDALSPSGDEVDAALSVCRRLYAFGQSGEALSLARTALERAKAIGEPLLMRRAATACGVLSADTFDLVGAIGYHVVALRLAMAARDDVEASRVWNCIGLAMGLSGHYELANRCYQRCLDLVEHVQPAVESRVAALGNLSSSLYYLGAYQEGLPHVCRAIREETGAMRESNLLNALLMRRTLVRLLVANGRFAEAEPYVLQCSELAARVGSPRAAIAASLTRAAYELAKGQTDLALTRLERAVETAREVPANLRDALTCLVRAEEEAGNVERALVRMNELSEHIYRLAIQRAREHVELASLAPGLATKLDFEQEQARARLVSKTSPANVPEAWSALDRLGVTAAMRRDASGWHGKRVGVLVKNLALASGVEPLPALEMGLAAELHDIGLMSVPDGILGKSGLLNEAERAIVRRHVDAGGEMLRDDRHPRVFLAREIARYHHARWDGEGYPEAVAANRIPFAARICAVADAYDAMVCGLGAKPPLPMDAALAELRAQSGRQFDPQLVECFDHMIRTETEELGMELTSKGGLEGFQSLVNALQEDRGFV